MVNKKRLIDANDYKDVLYAKRNNPSIRNGIQSAMRMLEKQPTVDAVEVVHGRWLFVTKGQQTSLYVCSECNRAVVVVCDEDKIKEQLAKNYPYCHCGAKMDGDSDG